MPRSKGTGRSKLKARPTKKKGTSTPIKRRGGRRIASKNLTKKVVKPKSRVRRKASGTGRSKLSRGR